MWWIVVSLVVLGILLMLAEMLLIPGVGVAGFLGLASMVAACWCSFTLYGNIEGIITTIVTAILLTIMLIIVLREKTWKRFELGAEIKSTVNEDLSELKEGQVGKTLTRLAPMGTVEFEKGSFEAKSYNNSMVDPGVRVEILRIEDNKVIVKPLN